jgi:hypothetical protein
MMTKLELAPFTASGMNYIKEYCKVSEPVAVALDMLQGEAQAYFGTLLLTIIVAKQMLETMITHVVCSNAAKTMQKPCWKA